MDQLHAFVPFISRKGVSSVTLGEQILRREEHPHPPLIKLLAIVSALNINILPITWRSALEDLGAGATGTVSQSPINATVSFAFKRFNRFPDESNTLSDAYTSQLQYNAMVAEIIALGSTKLYEHPNIVKIEGLSWEIVHETGEVLPVIVFRKSEIGTLENWISSSQGPVDFEHRLAICRDVAEGLKAIHDCGLVHGDLKPENILVFEDSEIGRSVARITDFGFSSLGKEDDLVLLPCSPPWEAPEYHNRWFAFQNAKRMDVFSFGLLALWIFFPEKRLSVHDGRGSTLWDAFSGCDDAALNRLQNLKYSGDMLDFAQQAVSESQKLSRDIMELLHRLMTACLEYHPGKRATDMTFIADLFGQPVRKGNISSRESVSNIQLPNWHGKIEIGNFFFRLDSCDMRIQKRIASDLAIMANDRACSSCSQNAAFQLAICHSFGFGVHANAEKRDEWLSKSGYDTKGLESVLDNLKQEKPNLADMKTLIELGFESDLINDYARSGILEHAVSEYELMASSRESILGSEHFATKRMYGQLGDLLRVTDDIQRAIEIYSEQLELAYTNNDQQAAGSIPILKSKLSKSHSDAGRYEEAEILADEVIQYYSTDSPTDFVLWITAVCDLCNIYLRSRNFDKAIQKSAVAIEKSEQYLGLYHRNTWGAKRVMAAALSETGDLTEAIRIDEEVVEEMKQHLGPESLVTLEVMEELGNLCITAFDWPRAAKVFNERADAIPLSSEYHELHALIARSNGAGAMARIGQSAEASEILENINPKLEKILGASHTNVVASVMNLGHAYRYQEKWKEAECVQREVLLQFRQIAGRNDPRTLTSLQNLIMTLEVLGKWQEVAELGVEELRIVQNPHSRTPNEPMVEALLHVARANANLENWEESVPQFEQELEWREELSLPTNLQSLEAAALAATGYLKLHEKHKAKSLVAKFFELYREKPLASKKFVQVLHRLATSLEEYDCTQEAIELFKLVVKLRSALYTDDESMPLNKPDMEKIFELAQR